ncbi:MAG: glycosyltransferase [Bacteroidia bacterium]|nr:glycosyltransferase [Bacteroidia bacterium]
MDEISQTGALLLALFALYLSIQLFITALLKRYPLPSIRQTGSAMQVLIPFRNEADVLGGLIESLKHQSMPLDLVFADDSSIDESRRVIISALGEQGVILAVPDSIHERYPGKHAVLAYAEKFMKTDVFFIADADMRFPPKWAQSLYTALEGDARLGAVCAPSLPLEKDLWQAFQRIEWASILYLIMALQRFGEVPTAIGNSMAVRRKAWAEVGGWEALSPTLVEDYEFLRALERAGWRLQWVFHPNTLGATRAEPSFYRWVQQRLRWRAAARRLSLMPIAYWSFQSILPWTLIGLQSWTGWIGALSLWITAEALPLWRFRHLVAANRILRYLPLLLIYRFIQGPWLLWLRFADRPIEWRNRYYPSK